MRAVVFVAFAAFLAAAAPTINPNTLTVSGISAGGAMTVQYQVAYSSKVHAAGVIAGIPYGCAGSSGVTGAFECMDDPSSINILSLDQAMNASAAAGEIDPVSNLPNQAAMLFSGTMDTVVNHDTMIALATQYGAVGISDVVTYFNYTAEHAWITNDWGNSCSTLSSPYINNCGLDFAGEFLEMAFKHMNLDFNSNRGTFANSHLKKFNQTVFGADGFFNSLDVKGYYYVPAACKKSSTATTTCHVHLNFHGCEQSHSVIGTEYVVNTGLNEWAETNNIIVVYPQAVGNDLLGNPNACFDWWGYAGSNYATKAGAQLQAFDKIITYLFDHGELPSA